MPLPGELILQGYTQNDKDTLLEIHGRPTSLTASISSIIGSPTASHARHSGQGGRMSSVYALSVRGSISCSMTQEDTSYPWGTTLMFRCATHVHQLLCLLGNAASWAV